VILINPGYTGPGCYLPLPKVIAACNPSLKRYLIILMQLITVLISRNPSLSFFVTPDFNYLSKVLNDFADKMAFRTGGLDGIKKAIRSENTGTCVFSSGLQLSGTFTEVIEKNGEPVIFEDFRSHEP